jgi:hypothetical protein
MASLSHRIAQPRASQLLSRILEQPDLVHGVRKLEPRAFHKLIDHIGLEDAGELIALATTQQLQQIFDEDLWRRERPGHDERFDADRFALWLEVMLEVGEDFVARKLTELPEDLVTLALHRHILVINLDELAVRLAARRDDKTQLEKDLESALSHEFEGYQVLARHEEGWDAILGALVALDEKHHDFLYRILDRCSYASAELIEESGGLHNVLTSEQMLESDAAAEREDRRATAGYVAPSAAASFLNLARATALAELERATTSDPLTRAYFRGYQPAPASPGPAPRAESAHVPANSDKLLRLLQDCEVLEPPRPVSGAAQLTDGSAQDGAPDEEPPLTRALFALLEREPQLHARRMQELSYLANVLVAGSSHAGKSFRPLDAAQAVLAVCNLGFEHLGSKTRGVELLRQHGADQLFRIGWHLLHHQVAIEAAKAVARVLERQRPRLKDR